MIISHVSWLNTFLNNVGFGIASIAICISMYLMMDHNKNEYVRFLKFIRKSKVYWICCNCKAIVMQQLMEFDDDGSNLSALERRENMDVTEIDTKDISLPQEPVVATEISEVTMTNQ